MADAPETLSLIPQPHPSSPFVNRWKRRDRLVFRVWPEYKETHAAILRHKTIPIDGFMMTKEGRAQDGRGYFRSAGFSTTSNVASFRRGQ